MDSAAGAPKPTPLRFRLFLLAASGLVPLALVLLLSTVYLARERHAQTQRAALELSRALATAVDTELRSTVAVLENLAISAELHDVDAGHLSGPDFLPLARRVVDKQGWRMVAVADVNGEVLMRIGDSVGTSRRPLEMESMTRAISSRAPAVGPAVRGPMGEDVFAVRIPVVRNEQLQYVLSALVFTSHILNVVAHQQMPPSWLVTVYDQDGNQVARSKPNSAARLPPSLEALVNTGAQEGAGVTRTLEGVESHSGFSRVRTSQWIVAVAIPAEEANVEVYWLLAALGTGTAASLGLLAWLAWGMARGISGPIDVLKRGASALGAGAHVQLPSLGVVELDEVGDVLRQAAVERDVSNERRSKVEAEREQLLVRLEEALRLAERANRNKDEFLALLGHELRNPLAPIMNAVALLDLKGDEGTAYERAIIQRQLHYVTRLVDDLLDASRITSNRFVINSRPLRPAPVLEQTVESIRPLLGARKLALHIEPKAQSLWIRADEARLVQVFNNLLGNAIKFTRADGSIEVHANAREGAIEFVIRDDGVGMTPTDLKRVFDLFYQAPNSARGVSGGLGLGLAIVKSLVEMHSGTIETRSEGLGQGTTMVVTFPVVEPVHDAATARRTRTAATRTRVLVVDDNRDAADTLAALLAASGFVVQVAYTPQAALELVSSFQPEVAILDIGLPGMSGYELAGRMRALAFGGTLIALTGYGQQRDIDKAKAAGFDAHLTKPVEPDGLLQLIAKLLAGEHY